MAMTKAGTVKETGAKAGDVLIGIEPRNRNLRIRVDRDQTREGGRVQGSFELTTAGDGAYSRHITPFAGRSYRSAKELIDQIATRPGAAKVRHVLNRNGLKRQRHGTKLVLNLTDTQADTVTMALAAARQICGTKSPEAALEYICSGWLQTLRRRRKVARP
jgi:hypothetical protein